MSERRSVSGEDSPDPQVTCHIDITDLIVAPVLHRGPLEGTCRQHDGRMSDPRKAHARDTSPQTPDSAE
jgi:hypothetical protein